MPSIFLIGCGNMGSALLRGWARQGVSLPVHVVDPKVPPDDLLSLIARHHPSIDSLPPLGPDDTVVLAVKPQQMPKTLESLTGRILPETLVISIAAGVSSASLTRDLHRDQPVVRAMPNLPASVGQGVSAAFAGPGVTMPQRDQAQNLLSATGELVWVDDESLLDAVTALSGSGPAYVFLLVEILARAGETLGLPGDMAMTLARQTVIGSAAMLAQNADIPASTLRQNVTSPGGTTAAALDILMGSGADRAPLQTLFNRALDAAKSRAHSLNR